MCKMLLSINPEHVENILNGSKRFEFRKNKCRRTDVDKIVIYSTSPVKKIVAEAEINGIIMDAPEKVWDITNSYSGISKTFFDSYYKNRNVAVLTGYAPNIVMGRIISLKHDGS